MNRGKSRERRQCFHRDMTDYVRLCLVHVINPQNNLMVLMERVIITK